MTSHLSETYQSASPDNPYRVLPPLSEIIQTTDALSIDPELRVRIARAELDSIRKEIDAGSRPTREDVVQRCVEACRAVLSSRFEPVLNGTGVILHTNLGRAPVSRAAANAMAAAAASYLPLEIDPQTNRRGGRMDEVSRLMRLLTRAEATLVVNNNAAAVLLCLASTAPGRDVIVSRGEAVEIGGGFRIPDVVAQSGCRLVEVGTTNRTYASDFARAMGETTGAMLRVHPSNFRIEGFTTSPTTSELAALAVEHDTVVIEDLGSGALIDTARFGLRREPTVAEVLSGGASLVTFSGDKLLGGPQAGLICGRAELVNKIERHPLARAVRVDKATLAGVVATLRHYVQGDAETEIPVIRMLAVDPLELWSRAEMICSETGAAPEASSASIGGGSLPGEVLSSLAIALAVKHPEALALRLRTGSPGVFPIIRDGKVLIDLRTVSPADDDLLVQAIQAATS